MNETYGMSNSYLSTNTENIHYSNKDMEDKYNAQDSEMVLTDSLVFEKNVPLDFRGTQTNSGFKKLPIKNRNKKIEKIKMKESNIHPVSISQPEDLQKPKKPNQKQSLKIKLRKEFFKNECRFSCQKTTELSETSASTNVTFDFQICEDTESIRKSDMIRFLNHFDYLSFHEDIDQNYVMDKQTEMTAKSRAMLLNWILLVHQKFELSHQTFITAVNILDRFCSKVEVPSKKFQMLGLTVLFIASKFEEVKPPKLSKFIAVSDNQFSSSDIIQFESDILNHVNFKVSTNSPLHLLELMSVIHDLPEAGYNSAIGFLMSSCFDLRMCTFGIHKIVEACITLAKNSLSGFINNVNDQNLIQSAKFTLNFIMAGEENADCIRNIFLIALNLERAGLFAVSKLFMSSKRMNQ